MLFKYSHAQPADAPYYPLRCDSDRRGAVGVDFDLGRRDSRDRALPLFISPLVALCTRIHSHIVLTTVVFVWQPALQAAFEVQAQASMFTHKPALVSSHESRSHSTAHTSLTFGQESLMGRSMKRYRSAEGSGTPSGGVHGTSVHHLVFRASTQYSLCIKPPQP